MINDILGWCDDNWVSWFLLGSITMLVSIVIDKLSPDGGVWPIVLLLRICATVCYFGWFCGLLIHLVRYAICPA